MPATHDGASAVCIIDTSILLMILQVPNTECKDYTFAKVAAEMKEKNSNGERFFLPMTAIFETGNDIGKMAGSLRYGCAMKFVQFIKKAIEGLSPFIVMNFLEAEELKKWIDTFPTYASTGKGFGDSAIVHDWEKLQELHSGRRVYVWSADDDINAYDYTPTL